MIPSILFITGCSCAGKSTVAATLRAEASDEVLVTDIDQEGIPLYGRDAWLAWRAQQLLGEALEQDRPAVIAGVASPHSIISELERMDVGTPDLRFMALTINKGKLGKRLADRIPDDDDLLAACIESNLRVQDRLATQVSYQRHGHVVTASSVSPSILAVQALDILDL